MNSEVYPFKEVSKFLRYQSLRMSTNAGSGHPTSSLSAADLMAVLISFIFRYDFKNPDNINNDRLIFSKGHASPLYYALYAAAGAIEIKELDTYRKFGSRLEGHPTPNFPYTEASTGSLGQGLSVGVGLALAIRNLTGPAARGSQDGARNLYSARHLGYPPSRHPSPRVFVLLGDGEMAEGSVWEALEIASKYKLNNLVAILDVNRLGQSGQTMLGYNIGVYQKRLEAFGWATQVIDGHNFEEITEAFSQIQGGDKPYAIIAKTIKGKGISFLEDKEGWHGKPIPPDQLDQALKELGEVDLNTRVKVQEPEMAKIKNHSAGWRTKFKDTNQKSKINYKIGEEIATRKAYGTALTRLGELYPQIVAIDGDTGNSTYSEIFGGKFPERFFQMYIAEQNMVGTAVGFSRLGYSPFVSTFAAFLTRAYDQIRMANLSGANIKFCGSHAGVSIGEDGPSQMGLEDIAMFRALYNSVVLYPSDAVSTEKLMENLLLHKGISYLRTSRPATPVIYGNGEEFPIGGCKIHRVERNVIPSDPPVSIESRDLSQESKIIIIAAGVTLHEALKAQVELAKENIEAIVVDCYSIKPIDSKGLIGLARSASSRPGLEDRDGIVQVITVEDHWFEGGLGDAVLNVFSGDFYQDRQANPIQDRSIKIYKMAVSKLPRSGKPQELLDYEEISSQAIIKKVKEIFHE